jgi:hypothetical protein
MKQQEKSEQLNRLHEEILKAESFLNSTDYMTIREMEGGEPMPEEVKQKRAEARAIINECQAQILEATEAETEDFRLIEEM